MKSLTREVRRGHRDALRRARAAALLDAEGFQPIVFAVEHLGMDLLGKAGTLARDYREDLKALATVSSLSDGDPTRGVPSFAEDFQSLVEARNEAMHQGAMARHLTTTATRIALISEDALMNNRRSVAEFMVADPLSRDVPPRDRPGEEESAPG